MAAVNKDQRFGRLVVIARHPEPYRSPAGKPTPRWICRCDCDKEVIVLQNALTSKRGTRSCGCQRAETMRGIRPRNTKACVVCGKEYECPPSANKKTCSPECLSINRSRKHTGTKHIFSQGAIEAIRARPRSDKQKAVVSVLIEASKSSPANQRGPQHRCSKRWVLRDPSGNEHACINLLHWAREHTKDYFNMEPCDKSAKSIASGFWQIKRSMLGKLKRKNGQPYSVYTYKDWTLVAWGDPTNN